MPRLYPRLASIGAALLCLVACVSAHAKDTAMTQPNSLCFGRFIVDLPEGAEIQDMGQQSEYMYGEIKSVPFDGGIDGFEKKMRQRETELKTVDDNKGRALKESISLSPTTRLLVTAEKIFGEYDFSFEAYKLDHNQLF